jgi:hypothetical protein
MLEQFRFVNSERNGFYRIRHERQCLKQDTIYEVTRNDTGRGLCTKSGFQSALSERMTIAQQFTAGLDGREAVVREADD